MHFLNWSFLAGLLPLLGLPLLIHLLNKRFPQRFQFPSVERLKKTAAERSRIYRMRHLIMMLVRTLFLLLLLLVFLRPFIERFGQKANQESGRRVLLLIDRSMSMEYRQAGTSSRQRALIEVDKILNTLEAKDRVNALDVTQNSEACFPEFSSNIAEVRSYLQKRPQGMGRADFTQANVLASRLIAKGSEPVEIYYISDFQRTNWAQVGFQALPAQAKLFFIDVAPSDPRNAGIVGMELKQGQVLVGDPVELEVTVGNYSPETLKTTLTARLDRNIQVERPVEITPWAQGKVTVSLPATGPGLHTCEATLPADNLEYDNHYLVAFNVQDKEEIVTLSAKGDPTAPPIPFLHAALNPFPNLAGALLPRHLQASALDSSQLAGTRKVFITQSGPLSDAGADALAHFILKGGSVVWFLDDQADSENLLRVEKALGGEKLPLQLGPLRKTENVGTGSQQIATGDFKSRFLRLFQGTLRQDLGLLEFYDFHAASAVGTGKVLLRFADETPAMAVAEQGLGTLLLMNFSPAELSSNLARQRIFPAWIQDLVKQLNQTEPPPIAFTAGQLVQGEVWRKDLLRAPFLTPSGRVFEPKQEPLGERSAISFQASETGLYCLRLSDNEPPKYAFAVNCDPQESDLRPVDRSQLPVQLENASHAGFLAGAADYEQVARGEPLFHWFLLGSLGFLLLENLLQLYFRKLA